MDCTLLCAVKEYCVFEPGEPTDFFMRPIFLYLKFIETPTSVMLFISSENSSSVHTIAGNSQIIFWKQGPCIDVMNIGNKVVFIYLATDASGTCFVVENVLYEDSLTFIETHQAANTLHSANCDKCLRSIVATS